MSKNHNETKTDTKGLSKKQLRALLEKAEQRAERAERKARKAKKAKKSALAKLTGVVKDAGGAVQDGARHASDAAVSNGAVEAVKEHPAKAALASAGAAAAAAGVAVIAKKLTDDTDESQQKGPKAPVRAAP